MISMPSGVFKPYAGVSTAVLFFTKTGTGGTDNVWFYDMTADGYSLDDKRAEIKDNDIPDIIERYHKLEKENTKDFAMTQMDKLLSSEMKLINIGCSDAISTNSISRYLFYLLTYENPFFKPDFKLKKREMKKLEEKILIAETKFWYGM